MQFKIVQIGTSGLLEGAAAQLNSSPSNLAAETNTSGRPVNTENGPKARRENTPFYPPDFWQEKEGKI